MRMSPLTTSSDTTGSPRPSVASAHRGPHAVLAASAICEVTVPFNASAITRASAGVSVKTSRTLPLKARSRISPVGREPRLFHGDVADAGLEPERPAHPLGVNRPAAHLGRERAGEVDDVEASLGDVQPCDPDGARHLEPDRRLEPRVGARLHDRDAEPAARFVHHQRKSDQIGRRGRSADHLDGHVVAVRADHAHRRHRGVEREDAPAGRAIRRFTRSVTSAATGAAPHAAASATAIAARARNRPPRARSQVGGDRRWHRRIRTDRRRRRQPAIRRRAPGPAGVPGPYNETPDIMKRSTRARIRAAGPTVRRHVLLLLLASLLPASAGPALAQSADPPDPTGFRVTFGGEITATIGSLDPGFFNYASYDYSPLRNVRVILDTSLRATRHLEVLAQVRTDGISHAQVSALYLRVRPWTTREIDVQIGRVPPTFGLFSTTGYGADNPLVSRPLAYGYLTSLRPDALPRTVTDLIQMRGRGWLSQFPVGNTAPERGMPLIDAEHWDTGVQGRVVTGPLEWVGSVTTGTLANPRVRDDNGGRSLQGRIVFRPHPALAVGASGGVAPTWPAR